jgi:hypothetical protein
MQPEHASEHERDDDRADNRGRRSALRVQALAIAVHLISVRYGIGSRAPILALRTAAINEAAVAQSAQPDDQLEDVELVQP